MEGIALVMFLSLALLERVLTRRSMTAKPPAELLTDLCYWGSAPILRQAENIAIASVIAFITLWVGDAVPGGIVNGYGPLSRLPAPLMLLTALVISDLASYWLHRVLHVVPVLWRFHAIHHSSPTLRWSSAGRTHPANELVNYLAGVLSCLAVGLPLHSVILLIPIMTTWSVIVHSNFPWTFGKLGGFIVSPIGHHWHHTHSSEGGNKNFANIFSFWDRAFGSYYLPSDRLPEKFGLDDEPMSENYLKQLIYPFQSPTPSAAAQPVEPRAAWPTLDLPAELGPAPSSQRSAAPR